MTYTATIIPQAEVDLVTNNKPLLLATNLLDETYSSAWVDGASLVGTDYTATGYPTSRAFDRYSHLQTKPNVAKSTYYLGFYLGTFEGEFDSFYLGGHNLGTLGGLTLDVQIGTDMNFSGLVTIYSDSSITTDKRILALNLHDTSTHTVPYRYNAVRWMRLKISGASVVPKIGEVWFGRRRHLPRKFERELDDLRTGAEVNQFISRSGMTTNYVLSRGRQKRMGTTVIDTAADVGTVTDFWEETEQGSRPFIFCENPGTSPNDCQVMTTDPELTFPLVGPTSRNLTLSMEETAPYSARES